MKIEKRELLNALEIVKPGLSVKGIVEQSDHYIFDSGMIFTYNDDIAASYPLDLGLGRFTVPARELHTLLNKLPDGSLSLALEDNQLIIESKGKAGLLIEKEIRVPTEDLDRAYDAQGDWVSLPSGFVEGLELALYAVSRDQSAPALTCVHVAGNRIESCDNDRISVYTLDGKLNFDLLIPAQAVGQLIKYELEYMAESDGWVHFQTKEDLLLSCRVYSLPFLDIDAISPAGGDELIWPKRIHDAIERASIFSAGIEVGGDDLVEVRLGKNMITIKGRGKAGWFEENVRVKYSGIDCCFSVNPAYLLQFLPISQSSVVSGEAITFNGDCFSHSICTQVPV
jgi:DNA polymerase III sliding clamp (beta) subunit (PCNA family)